MRICFFTLSNGRGGAERVINILCSKWPGDDELFMLTCFPSDNGYSSPVPCMSLMSHDDYFRLGKVRAFSKLCKAYKKEVAKIAPDAVCCFLPLPCAVAYSGRKACRAALIGSERSNPYHVYRDFLRKKVFSHIYSRFDGFVFQTKGAQDFFPEAVRDRAVIIGNPLDAEAFSQTGHRQPERNVIVSVGRFTDEKNYPLLIEAFGLVHEQHPEAVLKIYGKENPSLGIREQIAAAGLTESVHLMGQTNDVPGAIRNAGIFVLSSKSEGMPNALMEAMALGLPCIATDCPSGGPRELIQDGENGLLLENNNAKAMAAAIIRLLDNPDLADRLGLSAASIRMIYNVEQIARAWKRYIYQVEQGK